MNKPLGFTSLLVTSFIFGTYGFFIRQLNPVLSASQQIYYRYAPGLLIVLILMIIGHKKIQFTKYLNLKVLLFGLTIPASFFLFNLTLLYAKLSVGVSGYYIGVLVVSLLMNKLFLKETIDIYGKLALVLIVFGFIFLSGGFSLQFLGLGLLFGILSGALYGVANFFKKYLKELDNLDILLIISFFNAVFMFLYSLLNGETPVPISLNTFFILLSFLLIALFGEYLTIIGFRNFNLYLGSIILSLEILFAGILGYVVYKEMLSPYEITGGVLVIVAIVLSNAKELLPYITKKKAVRAS